MAERIPVVTCAVAAGVGALAALVTTRLMSRRRRRRVISDSSKLTLKYFDIPALGEPIRVLLLLGYWEWEDDRIAFDDWPKMKGGTRWGQVPVLQTPFGEMAQSKAICRFLASQIEVDRGLMYPEDPLVRFRIDEFLECFEDVSKKFVPTMKIADRAEKEKARSSLFSPQGECTALLEKIDRYCETDDGFMVAGVGTTLADIWCFFFFKLLKCGFLEGIPTQALDRHSRLSKVERRIAKIPAIHRYYADLAKKKGPKSSYHAFADISP